MKKFEQSIKLLSDQVSRLGVSWQDEQYKAFSSSLEVVAKSSKRVFQMWCECERAINRFNVTEAER